MIILTSLLKELLPAQPHLQTQIYFKSSLIALCHAMEDQVLVGDDRPLVIASFQRERFFRQETHRYLQFAERTDQLYVLMALEADVKSGYEPYEIIPFDFRDGLSQEWHLVVIGQQYASCLLCQELEGSPSLEPEAQPEPMEQARRFESFWTFDRQISCAAAELLLRRILVYRPELAPKVNQAVSQLTPEGSSGLYQSDPTSFAERLVNYLQTGQYKLLKAYNLIYGASRKDRLINAINVAIRRLHNRDEILQIAVKELGQTFPSCRYLIYPCKSTDKVVIIQYEFLGTNVASLVGQAWPLQDNPLFEAVLQKQESIYMEDTQTDARLATAQPLQALVKHASIRAWLMVPMLYQGSLLGMVELHYCDGETSSIFDDEIISLIEVIATLVGVALIQAKE